MHTVNTFRSATKLIFAGSLLALASANANAESMSLGQWEYEQSCATCHGVDGKGKGPATAYLTKEPTDLTTLQKNNGGVFPVDRAYEVIDGRAEVAVHGPRHMPMWGYRYNREALEKARESEMPATPVGSHIYVHTRIMALIEYLSSIQEK